MKRIPALVIEGPAISKTDRELSQAILAGDMRNAWQKEKRSMPDLRSEKGIDRRPRDDTYRDNYPQIFGHE